MNKVWVEPVMLAHSLLIWTQTLLPSDDLVKAEPKRLRYQLLHVAGRLAFHSRHARLHLQTGWRWVDPLLTAFKKLRALQPLIS